MNLMRKLRGASSSASSDAGDAAGSSHVQLGLMHLKKLFSEYTHPAQPLTEAEKDDKLYNMLPLFCKVPLYFLLLLFSAVFTLTSKPHFIFIYIYAFRHAGVWYKSIK